MRYCRREEEGNIYIYEWYVHVAYECEQEETRKLKLY